jgi:hypothetical protein
MESERRRKAGHPEVFGETIAKFEFFQYGWNPYSRFLDVDKVDLILRRTVHGLPEYREVQGQVREALQEAGPVATRSVRHVYLDEVRRR